MSKLLRSELKEIVKECLVEILSEGIGNKKRKVSKKPRQPRQYENKMNSAQAKKRHYLESIEYGDIPVVKDKTKKKLNSNITKDPVLNSILADTAKTTLQEQLSAERRGNSAPTGNMDKAAQIVNQSDPTTIFGSEAASKWAQLAFFDQ